MCDKSLSTLLRNRMSFRPVIPSYMLNCYLKEITSPKYHEMFLYANKFRIAA